MKLYFSENSRFLVPISSTPVNARIIGWKQGEYLKGMKSGHKINNCGRGNPSGDRFNF